MCYTNIVIRICKVCNVEQPITSFEQIKRPSGVYYKHTCRECINAKKRKGTKKVLFNDGVNKQCGKCLMIKPHKDFAFKNGKPRHCCKDCHNLYYKNYYMQTDAYKKHKARVNKNRPKVYQRHGLSLDEFNSLKTVDGKCPICRMREQSVIDHDHSCCPGQTGCSNCVRGYICSGCNVSLGLVGDSVDHLNTLIKYLEGRVDTNGCV